MGSQLKINVDLDCCEGHGKCYRIAPDLFDPFDDHGHAAWIGAPIAEDDKARRAHGDQVIDECPEAALAWATADVAAEART